MSPSPPPSPPTNKTQDWTSSLFKGGVVCSLCLKTDYLKAFNNRFNPRGDEQRGTTHMERAGSDPGLGGQVGGGGFDKKGQRYVCRVLLLRTQTSRFLPLCVSAALRARMVVLIGPRGFYNQTPADAV